ncbi:MAG: Glu/Leu/Phe/Val dehydrogenase [Gemmatimonadales bacterium]|nr:MAG: Glu/Leu/Phe/Val dehydrogenase [Gemmatimonadales bacterium]
MVKETNPELFDLIGQHQHEQVLFTYDPSCDYKGIIAIHDSSLGPALGGTRFWDYASDADALIDVLRLARGMTYKAAVAGLNLGGGKSVIIGDNRTTRREMVMRAHGRAVESLGGRYITAEDVGTSVEDMSFIGMETEHVVGMAGKSGDPSPVTAYGVYRGIKACAYRKYGDDDLAGRSVMVQGAGHVGYFLARDLMDDGAKVFIADIDQDRVQRACDDLGCEAIDADDVFNVDADVLAPCALGAILNDDTIPMLKVDIVAGAANNQLARSRHAEEIKKRGILYAPDYVINAGGLINVYSELVGWTLDRSKRKAAEIYTTLLHVFELADSEGVTSAEAADRLAMQRVQSVAKLHRTLM